LSWSDIYIPAAFQFDLCLAGWLVFKGKAVE